MLQRMREVPANEAQLLSLRLFVAAADEQVGAMAEETAAIAARLRLLDVYHYRLPEALMPLLWTVMGKPSTVLQVSLPAGVFRPSYSST